MDMDGTDLQRLTFDGTARNGVYSEPAWSPDGTRIAFLRYPDIWSMAIDGTDHRLESPPDQPNCSSTYFSVVWSPDGRKLATDKSAAHAPGLTYLHYEL